MSRDDDFGDDDNRGNSSDNRGDSRGGNRGRGDGNRRGGGGGRGGRGGGRGGGRYGGHGGGGERYGRGGGGGYGGGGRGRHGGRGGGGGRGRGGGFRGGRGRGRPMAPAESGNQRERISVESGIMVLIDQFMLANPQFIQRIKETMDQDPAMRDDLIREFGGQVVELSPGTYKIERDPFKYTVIIHPEGERPQVDEVVGGERKPSGYVYIDTRCLAMIDRELLDDHVLLDKYSQLWADNQEKACRDLLRDNGGAVRYGFGRFGDELGVYVNNETAVVALWPDNRTELAAAEEAKAAALAKDRGNFADEGEDMTERGFEGQPTNTDEDAQPAESAQR